MFRKISVIFIIVCISGLFNGCSSFNGCNEEICYTEMAANKISKEERVKAAEANRGKHYARRLSLFIDDCPERKPGGIVFIGDSITEQFPIDTAFKGKNVINRGIGGDRISGVKERLDVSVFDLKPRKIYLMIGVNDLLWGNKDRIENLGKEYDELLVEMKKCAPEAEIIVFSVLPLCSTFTNHNSKADELNKIIKSMAKRENIEYFDLHPVMSDKNGLLHEEYSVEGLHLTIDGYLAWLCAILDKDEYFEACVSLSGLWKKKRGAVFPVNAIDPPLKGEFSGSRGKDQLIIYTPSYGHSSTGTNPWGREAEVVSGVVVKEGVGDSKIPKNGYVVSGHGVAAEWVSSILKKGVLVEYDEKGVKVIPKNEESKDPEKRLIHLRRKFMNRLSNVNKGGLLQADKKKLKNILTIIQEMDNSDKLPELEEIDELSEKLDYF
jgi:lysophospholipase L1-like esterase